MFYIIIILSSSSSSWSCTRNKQWLKRLKSRQDFIHICAKKNQYLHLHLCVFLSVCHCCKAYMLLLAIFPLLLLLVCWYYQMMWFDYYTRKLSMKRKFNRKKCFIMFLEHFWRKEIYFKGSCNVCLDIFRLSVWLLYKYRYCLFPA